MDLCDLADTRVAVQGCCNSCAGSISESSILIILRLSYVGLASQNSSQRLKNCYSGAMQCVVRPNTSSLVHSCLGFSKSPSHHSWLPTSGVQAIRPHNAIIAIANLNSIQTTLIIVPICVYPRIPSVPMRRLSISTSSTSRPIKPLVKSKTRRNTEKLLRPEPVEGS